MIGFGQNIVGGFSHNFTKDFSIDYKKKIPNHNGQLLRISM